MASRKKFAAELCNLGWIVVEGTKRDLVVRVSDVLPRIIRTNEEVVEARRLAGVRAQIIADALNVARKAGLV